MSGSAPQPDESPKGQGPAREEAGAANSVDELLAQAAALADQVAGEVGMGPKHASPPDEPPAEGDDAPVRESVAESETDSEAQAETDSSLNELEAIESLVERVEEAEEPAPDVRESSADAELDALDALVNGTPSTDEAAGDPADGDKSEFVAPGTPESADGTIDAVEESLASAHQLTQQLAESIGSGGPAAKPSESSASSARPAESSEETSDDVESSAASAPAAPSGPTDDVDAALSAMEDLIGSISGEVSSEADGPPADAEPPRPNPPTDEAPRDAPVQKSVPPATDEPEPADEPEKASARPKSKILGKLTGAPKKTGDDDSGEAESADIEKPAGHGEETAREPETKAETLDDDLGVVADELSAKVAPSLQEAGGPEPAWKRIARRLGQVPIDAAEAGLVYADIPFAALSANAKSVIGNLALATLCMAVVTWILALFIS